MNLTLKFGHKTQMGGLLIFFAVTVLAIVSVLKFKEQPLIQFQLLAILSMFYLIWALIHHIFDKSLTLEVVLEYAFTAILALVVFYGLLL